MVEIWSHYALTFISPLGDCNYWLGSLKEWKQHLIVGAIFSIVGIVVISWANSIIIPSPYSTFFGIQYSVNPQFEPTLKLMLVLFFVGFFSLGLGLGLGVSAFSLHKTEDKFTSSNSKSVRNPF